MGGFISYFFSESSSTEVTDLQLTEDSSPVANSPTISEKETSGLSYIPHENTPGDTPRTESIFQTISTSDHIEDVDKINIHVICAGKTMEIMIFPLEKISYLLQQACEQVHKKPENMKLIFKGEQLDMTKTVNQYPRLRRGQKVNLIRAA